MTNFDALSYFEQKTGHQYKQVKRGEWHGPCPWCAGRDRFRIWERGNYSCRPGDGHCGREGWADTLAGVKMSDTERRLLAVEREQARARREREDLARRLTAHERIAKMMPVADRYHEQLTNEDKWHWADQGIFTAAQEKYKLGVCHHCPLKPDTPSYTIPVVNNGNLRNIRHRLQTTDGDRYRPHITGLPPTLFNADNIKTSGDIMIVEGEKKSIVLSQYDELPRTVAVMGCTTFDEKWARHFSHFHTVYVGYDPDVPQKAAKVAGLFGSRGRVVRFPVKPDDFFYRFGGTPSQFMEFISLAR